MLDVCKHMQLLRGEVLETVLLYCLRKWILSRRVMRIDFLCTVKFTMMPNEDASNTQTRVAMGVIEKRGERERAREKWRRIINNQISY